MAYGWVSGSRLNGDILEPQFSDTAFDFKGYIAMLKAEAGNEFTYKVI
ncbi:MAG: hypothetical protein ACK5NT_03910 [Pyrinomonadaceae bacterium]